MNLSSVYNNQSFDRQPFDQEKFSTKNKIAGIIQLLTKNVLIQKSTFNIGTEISKVNEILEHCINKFDTNDNVDIDINIDVPSQVNKTKFLIDQFISVYSDGNRESSQQRESTLMDLVVRMKNDRLNNRNQDKIVKNLISSGVFAHLDDMQE